MSELNIVDGDIPNLDGKVAVVTGTKLSEDLIARRLG
jgi:hypothetical protein